MIAALQTDLEYMLSTLLNCKVNEQAVALAPLEHQFRLGLIKSTDWAGAITGLTCSNPTDTAEWCLAQCSCGKLISTISEGRAFKTIEIIRLEHVKQSDFLGFQKHQFFQFCTGALVLAVSAWPRYLMKEMRCKAAFWYIFWNPTSDPYQF